MQLLLNGLVAGSLAALIAGGLAFVYGVMGVFNLALGQMVLLGGYTTWWLHQIVGLPLIFSIIGGLIIGVFIAWITYAVSIRPFYKHHNFLPLVTTIALSMIYDGLIILLFGEQPRNIVPGLKKSISLSGGIVTPEQIVLIIGTIVLIGIFAYVLHSTSFGRKIRAVVQHDHAALSVGIRSASIHRTLFLMSGFLATCGGIFIGIDQNLSPAFAFSLTIKAYAAVIAGGKGNIWGAIICAYAIAILEQLIVGIHWFNAFYIPGGYQQSVALIVIILFLLIRPQGLFSSSQRTA